MQTYKLRAECLNDVLQLIKAMPVNKYTIESELTPDVEFTFRTECTMRDIICAMKTIPDSHVMAETVALEKDYTGERLRS